MPGYTAVHAASFIVFLTELLIFIFFFAFPVSVHEFMFGIFTKADACRIIELTVQID
jgi:hypothetical protein